jgi:hypothetical protein
MEFKRKILEDFSDRLTGVIALGSVVLSGLILLYNVLTHFPFFDEALHVHYLWQFSIGLRPGPDFFCIYPALGYLLTLPLMGIFPESALVFLGLRSLSLILVVLMGSLFFIHGRRMSNDWIAGLLPFLLIIKAPAMGAYFSEFSIDHMAALSAIAALTLCFTPPRIWSIAAASALAALSFMITPKYPMPLFFGLLGYLTAYFIQKRRIGKALAAVAAGVLLTLAFVVLIFKITDTSLTENILHSYLLHYRWSTLNADFGFQSGSRPVALAVLEFLGRNWVLCIAVMLGTGGWLRRAWRNQDAPTLAGAGILLGTVLSSFMIKDFVSQYVAPQVLCLALFVPFVFSLVRHPVFLRALRLAFVAGALILLLGRVNVVAQRFHETPLNARGRTETHVRAVGRVSMAPSGILVLADYAQLLEVIPENERVVAVWPFHPVFRRDLTIIGIDERPSYIDCLSPDDPMRRNFDPGYFLEALEKNPPALIFIPRLEVNYPPGWKEAAEEFLSRHQDLYVPFKTRFFEFPVRRDLIPSKP